MAHLDMDGKTASYSPGKFFGPKRKSLSAIDFCDNLFDKWDRYPAEQNDVSHSGT
jgi:hypothetical protein